MSLTLMSPAFAEGEPIPVKYTRDGENISPPLKWTGAPNGTKSFMLLVEDPDAPSGTFRRWAAYNIPVDHDGLAESIDTGPDKTIRHGLNDFGAQRYDGPEPPVGHGLHHYHFRLAALDVPSIPIPADAGAARIWDAAQKHIVGEAELIGTYAR